MGALWGGEKGKEVSGDARAGLRAGNELGTTITLPQLQRPQPKQRREQRGNDRLGWGGVGWGAVGGKNRALLCKEPGMPKTSQAGQLHTWVYFQIELRNGFKWLLHARHSGEPSVIPGPAGFQTYSKET